jgi:hypothetical protein
MASLGRPTHFSARQSCSSISVAKNFVLLREGCSKCLRACLKNHFGGSWTAVAIDACLFALTDRYRLFDEQWNLLQVALAPRTHYR